jgi:predicted PurR-regulated permease PerM
VVAILALLLIGLALYAVRVILVPLILASLTAVLLHPLARDVSRRTRLKHGLATLLIFVVLIGLLVPVGVLVIPAAGRRLRSGLVQLTGLVRYLDAAGERRFELLGFSFTVEQVTGEVTAGLTDLVTSAAGSALGLATGAARIIFLTVISFVIGFYLTRDGHKLLAWIGSFVPVDYQPGYHALLRELHRVWSSFFRGQLLLSLVAGIILSAVSALLGLPQPILLGVWGSLLEFLPSIGNLVWGATALLVAALAGSTYLPLPPLAFVLLVLAAAVVYAQVDLNILIPRIIGGSVRLHPIVVLLGVIAGIEIAGVLGAALAAPTIASLRIAGRYVYAMLTDTEPFRETQADIEAGQG